MIGDKLKVKQFHIHAARAMADILIPGIRDSERKCALTVAGESGAGKSEIAYALSKELSAAGISCAVLQQDDYFVYPPRTNAEMRRADISHVGVSEVKLSLLDDNVKAILDGAAAIEKPLVIYDEDRITSERLEVGGAKVVIVEGTYVTLLENAHHRIFIDRTYNDTADARKERAREDQDDRLEKVLEIEHGIISGHKPRADIIVTHDYKVKMEGPVGG